MVFNRKFFCLYSLFTMHFGSLAPVAWGVSGTLNLAPRDLFLNSSYYTFALGCEGTLYRVDLYYFTLPLAFLRTKCDNKHANLLQLYTRQHAARARRERRGD
jgi:hypothetical protein